VGVPIEFDDEPPRVGGHLAAGVGFGLLELESQVQEGEGWDDGKAEADAPGCSEMFLGARNGDNHGG
jgi:hypothetical protein